MNKIYPFIWWKESSRKWSHFWFFSHSQNRYFVSLLIIFSAIMTCQVVKNSFQSPYLIRFLYLDPPRPLGGWSYRFTVVRPSVRSSVRSFITSFPRKLIIGFLWFLWRSPIFKKYYFGQNFPKFNRATEAHQSFFSY